MLLKCGDHSEGRETVLNGVNIVHVRLDVHESRNLLLYDIYYINYT